MKDFISIIAAVVSGIFMLFSAYLTLRLKKELDNKAIARGRRKEKEQLYTSIFELFEKTIRDISNNNGKTVEAEFSKINANENLLAPDTILSLYKDTCLLLEKWSSLHFKANPAFQKIGQRTVTIINSPEPTEKYKKTAKEEYENFQNKLHELVAEMKQDL